MYKRQIFFVEAQFVNLTLCQLSKRNLNNTQNTYADAW